MIRTMVRRARRRKPSAASVFLHWLAASLFLLALATGLQLVYAPSGDRGVLFALHAYAGLVVLGLVVARLMLRILYDWPRNAHHSRLVSVAATAGHAALYGVMILIPLTGWLVASAGWGIYGVPGAGALAQGIGARPQVDVRATYDVHVSLAWLSLALILAHVLAVAVHHFVWCDATLRQMLPGPTRQAPRRQAR